MGHIVSAINKVFISNISIHSISKFKIEGMANLCSCPLGKARIRKFRPPWRLPGTVCICRVTRSVPSEVVEEASRDYGVSFFFVVTPNIIFVVALCVSLDVVWWFVWRVYQNQSFFITPTKAGGTLQSSEWATQWSNCICNSTMKQKGSNPGQVIFIPMTNNTRVRKIVF